MSFVWLASFLALGCKASLPVSDQSACESLSICLGRPDSCLLSTFSPHWREIQTKLPWACRCPTYSFCSNWNSVATCISAGKASMLESCPHLLSLILRHIADCWPLCISDIIANSSKITRFSARATSWSRNGQIITPHLDVRFGRDPAPPTLGLGRKVTYCNRTAWLKHANTFIDIATVFSRTIFLKKSGSPRSGPSEKLRLRCPYTHGHVI